MDETGRRIARLYRGEGGRFWERIELERPANYLEENVVLGRREEAGLLLSWMGELEGRRVLDAGCGRGRFARRLASAGARVVAADLVPRFSARTVAAARGRELALVAADLRDLLPAPGVRGADLLLLREVLQDYSPPEHDAVLRALAAARAERLLLTLRLESRWALLEEPLRPPGMAGTVEPTALLRRIHLLTSYRFTRQQDVRRRNFRSRVVEMALFE